MWGGGLTVGGSPVRAAWDRDEQGSAPSREAEQSMSREAELSSARKAREAEPSREAWGARGDSPEMCVPPGVLRSVSVKEKERDRGR